MKMIHPPTIKSSPWGAVQQQYEHAPGIVSVSCANHGGFLISKELNDKIPEPFRIKAGWYEEDCAAFIVLFFLCDYGPHEWRKDRNYAHTQLVNWFWEKWEAYTGETIPEGISRCKDEEMWRKRHHDRFVVKSALRLDDETVGVCAEKVSTNETAWFRVPKDEYTIPFVVDESRHERSKKPLF